MLLGACESLLRCAANSGRPDPAQVRPGRRCRRLLSPPASAALPCRAPPCRNLGRHTPRLLRLLSAARCAAPQAGFVSAFLCSAGALRGLVSGPRATAETRGAFLALLGALLDAGAEPVFAALAAPESSPAAPEAAAAAAPPPRPRFAPGGGGAASEREAEGAAELMRG